MLVSRVSPKGNCKRNKRKSMAGIEPKTLA
jgi:hypothetical protein